MDQIRGFSIRIFVPSGLPEGVRLISKSNWCGLGIEFPRTAFAEARRIGQLAQTGVYILIDPFDAGGLPKVYVGEADDVAGRLGRPDHVNRDFWTRAIAFVSKDQTLNKTHAKFIEADLYKRAKDLGKYELENRQKPGSYNLSEEDRQDALAFLDDVLLCLRTLGYDGFEAGDEGGTQVPRELQSSSLPDDSASISVEYKVSGKGVEAKGFETSGGGFRVLSGSGASGQPADKWLEKGGSSVQLRQTLIERGVLVPKGAGPDYEFHENYEFRSPSLAVGIVLAGFYSGPSELEDASGQTLRDNRQSGADGTNSEDREEDTSADEVSDTPSSGPATV